MVSEEINKLALEIKQGMEALSTITDSSKRIDKVNGGLLYMLQFAREYSFKRFYKLAEESSLTQETKDLYKQYNTAIQEAVSNINEKDIPQELQEFLNGGKKD